MLPDAVNLRGGSEALQGRSLHVELVVVERHRRRQSHETFLRNLRLEGRELWKEYGELSLFG